MVSFFKREKIEQKKKDDKDRGWFESDGQLAVDVYETGKEFIIISAIAGITIENLDVSVERDILIIKGNRSNPTAGGEKNYFYQECYWGPFSKKIILPENIDSSRIDAAMDKGILIIKIPKIQREEKKKIEIRK